MGMDDKEYELLDYLERSKAEGREKINLFGYPMETRMYLLAQSLIKANADKSQGNITAFGTIALAKERSRRKHLANGVPLPDEDAPEIQLEPMVAEKKSKIIKPLPSTVDVGTHLVELNRKHFKILKKLRDMNADGRGVSVPMHHNHRKTLERYELIRVDKNSRVWLLPAGQQKLAEYLALQSPEIDEESPVQKMHIALIDPTPAEETPIPNSNGEGEQCVNECDECLHRDVLDLIVGKYPKVAELRDVLMQQKRLMKELGL